MLQKRADLSLVVSVPACTFNNSLVLFPSFLCHLAASYFVLGGRPPFPTGSSVFHRSCAICFVLCARQRPRAARGEEVRCRGRQDDFSWSLCDDAGSTGGVVEAGVEGVGHAGVYM